MDKCTFVAVIFGLVLSSGGLLSSSLSPARSVCPERCDCQHAQHVLCTNRGLRAVPKVISGVPEEVLVISLGGNFISNISAFDLLGYSNLIRLNLQFNQIQTIHPKAFDTFSKLEELYLGHNLLSTIPAGTLQPLKKLTILYTNNNGIEKITPQMFANLDSLVKLRLDGNSIEELQDSVFRSLTNLHYLHLEYNKVQQINRNAFSKLVKLRFLNLAHNKQSHLRNVFIFSQLRDLTTLLLSENEIKHVGNDVFQHLKKLSKLSLRNNKISRLESGALNGLTSLKELLIDGNELVEIPSGLLNSLELIEELDFSSNHISYVDSLAFSQLKQLRVLKLKDNHLTSLSGDMFALNNVLYDLDLHGNNWTCDCRLEELKRWMTSAHSEGKLLTVFIQCGQPAILKGKYLDYVNSSQLLSLGNLTHMCNNQAGLEESRGEEVLEREVTDSGKGEGVEMLLGEIERGGVEPRSKEYQNQGARRWGEVNQSSVLDQRTRAGVSQKEGEKRKRARHKEPGVQGDQGGQQVTEAHQISHLLERQKIKKVSISPRSRGGGKRAKDRHRTNAKARTAPTAYFTPTTNSYSDNQDNPPVVTNAGPTTSASVQSGEQFDLLRASQEEVLPVITDPCTFNRHFITNVTVDQITSSTVTVHWTTKAHLRYSPEFGGAGGEVHYRVLFDRFGTPDRFPRYVYARSTARSVTLRELSSDVTYMACVEGVVGGSVCHVAPRDHCVGLVTLPEGAGRGGSDGGRLSTDLHLVTVVALAGNAVLLLAFGGVWLARSLRRRLQKKKSAVHVRHMYTSRRPLRHDMAAAAVSADFTSYQCSRPPRLGPLEEGDLIEFPCDRFLDNSTARRDSDMQRFSD